MIIWRLLYWPVASRVRSHTTASQQWLLLHERLFMLFTSACLHIDYSIFYIPIIPRHFFRTVLRDSRPTSVCFQIQTITKTANNTAGQLYCVQWAPMKIAPPCSRYGKPCRWDSPYQGVLDSEVLLHKYIFVCLLPKPVWKTESAAFRGRHDSRAPELGGQSHSLRLL